MTERPGRGFRGAGDMRAGSRVGRILTWAMVLGVTGAAAAGLLILWRRGVLGDSREFGLADAVIVGGLVACYCFGCARALSEAGGTKAAASKTK